MSDIAKKNDYNYARILNEVKCVVKDACTTEDRWKYHIYPVVEYGKMLAKKLGADIEIVELACWLHDLTRVRGDVKNHHKTSSYEATIILKKLKYSPEKIKKVSRCIYAHRGSCNIKKTSIEEEIVACADAMSHFEFRIILFYSAFGKKEMSLEDGAKWIDDKIERSWKKLTIPFARKMVEDKYKSIKEILSFTDKKICQTDKTN
ncbi:MAG: HD domain-containing protein [Candidatus Moranbacteria bacterium]|nr:HD domain-containing protein [Candidatus Moranbacteria bacterium]